MTKTKTKKRNKKKNKQKNRVNMTQQNTVYSMHIIDFHFCKLFNDVCFLPYFCNVVFYFAYFHFFYFILSLYYSCVQFWLLVFLVNLTGFTFQFFLYGINLYIMHFKNEVFMIPLYFITIFQTLQSAIRWGLFHVLRMLIMISIVV